MSGHKSEGSGSFLLNPNALLALVTVASGWWLVSQKLSSDRPLPPTRAVAAFMGEQKLATRLWEDPLKDTESDAHAADIKIDALAHQIRSRATSTKDRPLPRVLVLPVLLSGGQYSEDQESRIRSRFAVVSALGREGYAPVDAEHIGSVRLPWLTAENVKVASKQLEPVVNALWEESGPADNCTVKLLGIPVDAEAHDIHFRFEWYRPRTFDQDSGKRPAQDVLVLWLDESHFEDAPALRLALLLERLTGSAPAIPDDQLSTAIIGPRRSSTLRHLLPNWETGIAPLAALPNARLGHLAHRVLKQVDLYAATPSSMDEVLVNHAGLPELSPRESIRRKLADSGPFRSFRNYTATDAQMAQAVLKELKLRKADLANPKNHVVLITEWDTFYARMLSLTYLAELARFKDAANSFTRAQFVDAYRDPTGEAGRKVTIPTNLHSFVYLRGLDGQALGGPALERKDGNGTEGAPRAGKSLPWEPDINRAEGQAQFDYLGRLGDQIEALCRTLRYKGEAVRAIGIVGSDVYDTLLILQALRHRFSDVHFFTTDLDVRFLHPRERTWARNLIVASAYGLELHEDLQGTVAPFRDSAQTAQFAATLAALGNKTMACVETIPPRRFEVGHRVAVNLSPPLYPQTHPKLHPLTTVEAQRARADGQRFYPGQVLWALVAASILLLVLSGSWEGLRLLTWSSLKHLHDGLTYREQDIGDPEDVEPILVELARFPAHPVANWLLHEPRLVQRRGELTDATNRLSQHEADRISRPPTSQFDLEKRNEERAELERDRDKALSQLMVTFVERLNEIVPPTEKDRQGHRVLPPLPATLPCNYGYIATRFGNLLRSWSRTERLVHHYQVRKALDDLLAQVHRPASASALSVPATAANVVASQPPSGNRLVRELRRLVELVAGRLTGPRSARANPEAPASAADEPFEFTAREAAQGIFRLRCRRLLFFWIGVAVFGGAAVVLTRTIWLDTFDRDDGEPFSLTAGTSAWPAEIVRFAVITLAVCFCVALALRLREAFLVLTRDYRLSVTTDDLPAARNPTCALYLWHHYREGSRFLRRWWRVLGITALYFGLLISIWQVFPGGLLQPVRGVSLTALDDWLIPLSTVSFLFLAFMTADAACRCRAFIEKLSARPTLYPDSTHRHFKRQLGRIEEYYIDEWIDLQLIADLTEKVGRLVYFPAALLVLLVLARNSWWDRWPWPTVLIVAFSLNFMVALASVIILQRAAKRAKAEAERSLTVKVKRLQAQAAPSAAQNNASQAEKLLEEIRALDRGAFVPFWENPVVGAIFLSSGGTTLLQAFFLFMDR